MRALLKAASGLMFAAVAFGGPLDLLALGCSAAPPPAAPSGPAAAPPAQGRVADRDYRWGEPEPQAEAPPAPSARPGWLGVELARRLETPGVVVRSVVPGSPAERAGVAGGDVLLSIDGESVSSPSEVIALIGSHAEGERVPLVLLRGGSERLLAVTLEAAPNDEALMQKRYVGAPAPAFASLETVQGSLRPDLNALRGRVVLVEFWASWCVPCGIMAPLISSWSDRYGARGMTVIGVTGDPLAIAADGARRNGMSYAVFSDATGATTLSYRAFALPTLFVVDRKGTVRDVMVGYSRDRLREVEGLIERLLAER